MDVDKIDHLEDVLQLRPNQSITDCKITRLTAPGENYGSLIVRLEVKLVDNTTKTEENLDLVAKLLPPNEIIRKVFNIQTTFRNESGLYGVIVPVLEDFQKQHGLEVVDIFPKYYGSRISLNPNSDEVDNGAVLILENLKPLGYITADRRVGFDLVTSKFLVKNLAFFHAIPLALKLKNPTLFEKKVKPYLADFRFPGDVGIDRFLKNLFAVLSTDQRCVPYFDRIEEIYRQSSLKEAHEPFATILHNDYWVNNMLLKYENGKPVGLKMVDFQIIEYKCPTRDLLFFLFTSVQLKVLQEHLDSLLDVYYESLIGKLQEFKCDVEPFRREVFEKRLELAAREAEFFHILMMLVPIHEDPNNVREINEMSYEDFEKTTELSEDLKAKLLFVTLEFIKREWINNK